MLGMGLCLGVLAPATPALAASPPTISGFTPTSGTVGTRVAITGTNFSGATAVRFNNVSASFKVLSSTSIGAVVPVMPASSGVVSVTTPAGTGRSSISQTFTVLPAIALSPATGAPGSPVTVSGTGFGVPDQADISFDGTILAMANTDSTGSFTKSITVPAAAGGIHAITAAAFGGSAQASFTVTPAIAVSPATGPPSSKVTVSGIGFGSAEGADIYFDTTDLALAGADPNGSFGPISITVPVSAVPGTHWISAQGRHSGQLAQASFAVNTNWAQFRYSAKRQGANPYENVLSPSTVPGIDQDWSFAAGGGIASSPAVVNGDVYVGSSDGNVYGVNAGTGAQLWSFATGGSVLSSPAVANGDVYVGSGDGNVYALNPATGTVVWSFDAGAGVESSPTVANGVVYVGSDSGTVYAISAATGAQLWSFTTGGSVGSFPAVANGVVYVGSGDHNLYALRATTGTQLWSFATGGSVASAPAVANGVVYVGSYDGNVYAINASTGAQRWLFTTGGSVGSSAAVANGVVYVGSSDGNVYALRTATGAQRWSSATGGSVGSSAAVANGVVYVGSSDGNVYAFDAGTGAQLWSYATGDGVVSSPAVANGWSTWVPSTTTCTPSTSLAASPPQPAPAATTYIPTTTCKSNGRKTQTWDRDATSGGPSLPPLVAHVPLTAREHQPLHGQRQPPSRMFMHSHPATTTRGSAADRAMSCTQVAGGMAPCDGLSR
jgi:outer membrane protein assembly factor BamB